MIDSRRFAGTGRLYGYPASSFFGDCRVAVIGIGGVGTWSAEALARTGIGALRLIDLDMVAESNTNRQLHALGDEYGRAKVDVMAERIRAINPACQIEVVEDYITPENVEVMLEGKFDFVIDAIDQTRAKVAIANWCRQAQLSLVICGAAGGRRDPTKVRVDDLARTHGDSLLSRVRQQLRQQHGFSRDLKRKFDIWAVYSEEAMVSTPRQGDDSNNLSCTGYGSTAVVTGAFGLAAASVVLNELARRSHAMPPVQTAPSGDTD